MVNPSDFKTFVSTFDTIIFDMDGTLFDLNVDWINIKNYIAQKYEEYHQKPFPFTNFLPLFHYLQDNQENECVQDCLEYLKTKEIEGATLFAEPTWLIKDYWTIFRNFNPLIENYGIVSSNFHQTVITVLQKYNLQNQFKLIIGRDDVIQLKPFPEGLMKSLNFFNTSPEKCLYIGDMPSDAETAQKANIQYIDISDLKKIMKNA